MILDMILDSINLELNIKIEDYLNDNIIVEDENVFNKLSSLEYIKKNFYKFEIIICDGMDVLPKIAMNVTPYNVDVADPIAYTFSVHAPKMDLDYLRHKLYIPVNILVDMMV